MPPLPAPLDDARGLPPIAARFASRGAGCSRRSTQLLGIEPWGNGGSTGASSSGAGSGGIGGGCTGGAECLTVPLSWRGPAALTVPGGGCGGAFAHRVARGKTDVAGAPAVCGCTCKPAHGEVCSSATLGVFSDPSCTPASGASLDLQSTCASGLSGKPLSAQSISVTAAAPSAGQCDGDATVDQPAPTFDERSLCQPEAAGSSCGDTGACIPVPDGALMPRLCVWVEGHADSCPGDFTERFDLYRGDVVDTRGCTACTCGPSDGSCVATAFAYGDGACGTPKNQVSSEQGCVQLGSPGFASASATYALKVGSCAPVKVQPTGTVTASGPVTVCCTNAF